MSSPFRSAARVAGERLNFDQMNLKYALSGLCLFLCLSFPGFTQGSTGGHKDKTTRSNATAEAEFRYGIGSAFPDFEYVDPEKQKHHSSEILGKDLTLLVIFNPTCTHCIESARLFQENLDAFEHARIFYLAGEGMLPYLDAFYQETGLQKDGPVRVGVDNSRITYKLFLYQNLPQINVYDKAGLLIDQMTGEAALEELLQYRK